MRPVLLFVLTCLVAAHGAEFRLFKNTWGDVIVATDMTKEGKGLTPPTKERPVY